MPIQKFVLELMTADVYVLCRVINHDKVEDVYSDFISLYTARSTSVMIIKRTRFVL